ncbi:UNVERIFIED_CONTAM: hypothetical protein GTU68_034474 [Idotea baltica]|nr:hypothetical protein [Idotea baltica]
MVKELRERTGAGMMECKKALGESGGDMDAAIELMRKSGQAKADKKASRVAAEGTVVISISDDAKSGVILEVNCETDFVGKDDNFLNFSNEVASAAIAASKPACIDESGVSAELLQKEKEIFIAKAESSGKPAEIIEKMVGGQIKKFLGEITLMGQPFVKDPDKSVAKLLKENSASVISFHRYEVGEGIEKKTENFAEEVHGSKSKTAN